MKPTLTTYLLLILISFSCFQLNAQKSDTTRSETVLKLENPYKKNRTKWLNENGFNTSTYSWDDPVINLYLDQAVKNRSTGNVLGYTGGGILVLGLLVNGMGALVREISDSRPGEPFQVVKEPYYLGGAMVLTSICVHINAKSKLKKAIEVLNNK
jgi:hypothetical protein